MLRKKKSQSVLIYAALIAAVITALLIMSGHIQRRIQGIYKQAGDAYGDGEQK